MQRGLLLFEQECPILAVQIGQTPPDKVIDLVSDDVDEIGRVVQQGFVEDNFATRQKAGGVYGLARPFPEVQLAAMGTQVAGEADI